MDVTHDIDLESLISEEIEDRQCEFVGAEEGRCQATAEWIVYYRIACDCPRKSFQDHFCTPHKERWVKRYCSYYCQGCDAEIEFLHVERLR